MSEIDFGRQSDDYARLRPGFPTSFYDRIQSIIPLSGIDVLDLGTGPGVVALDLAARGAVVTGLDISANQIASAQCEAAKRHLDDLCQFKVAPAEATGFANVSFDLVIAGQCWLWFDHDRVVTEVCRLLRPGGFLIVAFFQYLTDYSDVATLTENLILQFNPDWNMAGHCGIYHQHIDGLALNTGLSLVEQFCYDHDQPFTHEQWRGRIRTCNGVGSGTLTDEQVELFDQELEKLLKSKFAGEPMNISHRVWVTIVRKPDVE